MPNPRKSMEPELLDSVDFYDHQIEGIRRLARLKSFLLADDMGLGKSLQALTVFIMDWKMHGPAKGAGIGIVVCPVTLKDNWEDEIKKFTRINYVVLGKQVNKRTGKIRSLGPDDRLAQVVEFAMMPSPKILICNYEQINIHLEELNAMKFRVAIFDEAHNMKNPNSIRSSACLALKSYRSFMLTGTPLLNNVTELWPLLNRIAPDHFSNFDKFCNRYASMSNGTIVGTKNVTELNEILGRIMLRRLKKDVLSLPIPYVTKIFVPLSPKQRQMYDKAWDDCQLESINPNGDVTVLKDTLTQFLRLKQICGTPYSINYDSKDPDAEHYVDESYKLDLVVEKAKEEVDNGEKVVIFTQFRGVVDALYQRLAKAGVPVMQLHGGVAVADRQPLVKQWSDRPDACVIVCMIQIAGTGLNMVASKVGFFVDKLFVPGLNQQCIDRLWRIGASQTQPVQIFEFIAAGTIEKRIEDILKQKLLNADDVVERVDMARRLVRALQTLDKMEMVDA